MSQSNQIGSKFKRILRRINDNLVNVIPLTVLEEPALHIIANPWIVVQTYRFEITFAVPDDKKGAYYRSNSEFFNDAECYSYEDCGPCDWPIDPKLIITLIKTTDLVKLYGATIEETQYLSRVLGKLFLRKVYQMQKKNKNMTDIRDCTYDSRYSDKMVVIEFGEEK